MTEIMKSLKYKLPSILLILILATTLFLSLVFVVSAKVGVGMGAGKIHLEEDIKPGGIYTLPSLRVFNTGDETTLYGMGIAYHQENPELRPLREWFIFNPDTFTLEPEQSQEVSITMVIPVKAEPGDYFSFLESGPVPDNKPGTSIGVAVGAELYFTIVPANIFKAVMYRISSFFNTYSPWTWIGLGLVLFILLTLFFRRFFSFRVAKRKK